LKIAEKHNLCFKRSKCDFKIEEIPILGVVVGKGQVQKEIYPELQSYNKTIEQVEMKEGMDMDRGIPIDI